MSDVNMTPDRADNRCDYCGDLEWTVTEYGRTSHKEQCPHRSDPWSQTYPKCEHRASGRAVGWFS